MRESDRLVSLWVREGGRLKKRERRESETDVPKLYPTMNMNSLCTMSLSMSNTRSGYPKQQIYRFNGFLIL